MMSGTILPWFLLLIAGLVLVPPTLGGVSWMNPYTKQNLKRTDVYNVFYRHPQTVSPKLIQYISSDPLLKRNRKEDEYPLQILTESDIIRPNVVFRSNGGSVHYRGGDTNSVHYGGGDTSNSVYSAKPAETVIRVTSAPMQLNNIIPPLVQVLTTSGPENYDLTDKKVIGDAIRNEIDAVDSIDEFSGTNENTIVNESSNIDSKHLAFLKTLLGYGKHPLHLYYAPLYPVNTYFYIP